MHEPNLHLIQNPVLLDFNLFGGSVVGAPRLIPFLFEWTHLLLKSEFVWQIACLPNFLLQCLDLKVPGSDLEVWAENVLDAATLDDVFDLR